MVYRAAAVAYGYHNALRNETTASYVIISHIDTFTRKLHAKFAPCFYIY